MNLRAWWTVFRIPHVWSQVRIVRDIKSFLRFHFLYAAVESGLLDALRTPASKETLIQQLHIQRPELFGVLLELGVSLRELSQENGLYRLRGKRAQALRDSDSLAALLQEYVVYHSSVYRHLAARMTGAPPGHYLETAGNLIARSSRTWEPFIANFMRDVLKKNQPMKILDVGCGSGIYLRRAAEINPQITGLGIDMHHDVVKQAAANLSKWGLGDRFKVIRADIRYPPASLVGPFDLITLYNNLYYFLREERTALFRTLRSMLAPNASLAIVSSMMQGNHVTTIDIDLLYRSTVGGAPLPEAAELTAQLRESGFRYVRTIKLMPLEPFYGIVAT